MQGTVFEGSFTHNVLTDCLLLPEKMMRPHGDLEAFKTGPSA
ncbi:MAG: hypothetical protein H6Q82_1146 [Deltaproteobacteria bacterium]|jgi:hypothetical protein|nr:hypothetical protein [Deltaproteobacteria bacterium]